MREKKRKKYDVVIIGAGAAGLTAAIYCGRAKLSTLVMEKALVGGLATYTNEIENFPGFPEGTTGIDLMNLFQKQAKKFGVEFKLTDVKSVNFKKEIKEVETFRNIFECEVVIIASGGKPRITGAKNEDKFLFEKGISFCATCDAAANTDKTVMVIGSGDAAIEEGTFLTKFAKKVIVSVIHNEGKMDCNEIAKNQALLNPKMEFKWNTVVNSFEGDEHLDRVILRNIKENSLEEVKVDTCFEFIGYLPNTEIFKDIIDMSEHHYILSDQRMATNIPGVFTCGDVREKELKQVATAVGDGAIAGVEAEKFIDETHKLKTQIFQKEKIGLVYIYSAIDENSKLYLPTIETIAKSFGNKVKLNILDYYKGKSLCLRLGEDVVPQTILFIKNGEIVFKTEQISIVEEKLKSLLK